MFVIPGLVVVILALAMLYVSLKIEDNVVGNVVAALSGAFTACGLILIFYGI